MRLDIEQMKTQLTQLEAAAAQKVEKTEALAAAVPEVIRNKTSGLLTRLMRTVMLQEPHFGRR